MLLIGRQHTVWPIILLNYNLSPEIRFKQENIVCFGIVPGPKKPSDFKSFLWPLVQQFKILHRGVEALDGSQLNARFTLRAHIVVIGTDMPAKDMLMGLSGHSARHYCNYCSVRGIYSRRFRHMYAPLSAPTSVAPEPDWRSYNPTALPIRDHDKSKIYARHVEDTGDAEVIQKTGIKGFTPFWDLPSIIFPWSYAIDSMHLFYLNIAHYMRDHWAGMTTPSITPDGVEEPYCISQADWQDIDTDIDRMIFPVAFGDKPRSIFTMRKASEWKTWLKVISPVVLKGRLAEPYYSEWINLVEAISLATDYSIPRGELGTLQAKFNRFVRHYEEQYYRHDVSRIAACKPVFHALLHVAEGVAWLGE